MPCRSAIKTGQLVVSKTGRAIKSGLPQWEGPGFGFPEPAVDGILCAPESIRIERTGVRLYGGHGREIERIAD
jgi:hypothetical protein